MEDRGTIDGAEMECRSDLDLIWAERRWAWRRQRGEQRRDLAAASIYFTWIVTASKKRQFFTLEETIGAQNAGIQKIKKTASFQELAKLSDEALRSLAAKDGGKQLTARYMKSRVDAVEMAHQKKQTKHMAQKAGLEEAPAQNEKVLPGKKRNI